MGPRSDERGNTRRRRWHDAAALQASMGPRSDERGNHWHSYWMGKSIIVLQWGRAPMSAEMALPERPGGARLPASMGPRSDERGNKPRRVRYEDGRRGFNGAALR